MEYRLKDCLEKVIDNRGKNPKYFDKEKYPVIDNVFIKNNYYINDKIVNRYINQETYDSFLRGYVEKNMPIMTLVGSGIGNVGLIKNENVAIVQNTIGFKTKENLDSKYLYYWFLTKQNELQSFNRGSGQPSIKKTDVENMEIDLPDIAIQKKIVNVLEKLDDKIYLNNQINDNLLNIIDTYFDEIFTDIECTKRADEIADITIGKTPPRAKAECFTKKDNDIKWLSISDIGRCGIYVFDTSEKLTLDAVNKYNVKIIPENTIVLSFKLTVGRVAITNEKMATNEAIAHFNLYDDRLRSYIYTYLRKFDYDKLGSTSSIATAVNSKIIKAMPIKVPDDGKIEKFNKLADEILKIIRSNERENRRLGQLRDTLLPKLMNGELNLDKIEM